MPVPSTAIVLPPPSSAPLMRGRIDAARQAADDDDPGAREIARDFVGRDQAFLGCGARTNHRDRRSREKRAIAAGPDARGRVGNFRQ